MRKGGTGRADKPRGALAPLTGSPCARYARHAPTAPQNAPQRLLGGQGRGLSKGKTAVALDPAQRSATQPGDGARTPHFQRCLRAPQCPAVSWHFEARRQAKQWACSSSDGALLSRCGVRVRTAALHGRLLRGSPSSASPGVVRCVWAPAARGRLQSVSLQAVQASGQAASMCAEGCLAWMQATARAERRAAGADGDCSSSGRRGERRARRPSLIHSHPGRMAAWTAGTAARRSVEAAVFESRRAPAGTRGARDGPEAE